MGTIAKLSREGDARVESMPGFEGRYVEADGYVLGFESFEQAADFTPLYRGLPEDLCQSHHWGYVRIVFRISAHYMRRGFDGLLALAAERSASADGRAQG